MWGMQGAGVTGESWADGSLGVSLTPKLPRKERAPQAGIGCVAPAQAHGLQGRFSHLSNGFMMVWEDVPSS